MIDQLNNTRYRGNKITLDESFYLDLTWWQSFLPKWNGISMLYEQNWSSPSDMHLWSDASTVGFGAVYGNHWFSTKWSSEQLTIAQREKAISMPYLELFALHAMAATWAHEWHAKRIIFYCDNETVVTSLSKGSCRSTHMMTLVRSLFFIAAFNNFSFRVLHVSSSSNSVADSLSRLQLTRFRELCPDADRLPTVPLLEPILDS
jgi:hypothetical protein